jgi:polyhydroxyalkanoate synthesis regulator phasin
MINIIDLFFDDILKETSTGRVDCVMYYNVLFETRINGKLLYKAPDEIKNDTNLFIPTLEINNLEEFNKSLIAYYEIAKEFYKDSIDPDIDFDKSILTLLWNNATEEDFKNPVFYINKYMSFIKNKLDIDSSFKSIGFSEILDSNIEISLKKEPIYEETPYGLYVRCLKDNIPNYFPVCRFGISDNKAYIYAVQQVSKKAPSEEEKQYEKKIHRKLFKVNENFEKEEEIDNITNPENLTGINPSALISLTVLLSILEKNNIKEIIMPSFLPVRYNAKRIKNTIIKNNMIKKGKLTEEINSLLNDLNKEQDNIQRNISDKSLRNIRRLEYYFNNINVTSYPMELDTSAHINLSEYEYCNNPLLQEIYELNKKKSYKK